MSILTYTRTLCVAHTQTHTLYALIHTRTHTHSYHIRSTSVHAHTHTQAITSNIPTHTNTHPHTPTLTHTHPHTQYTPLSSTKIKDVKVDDKECTREMPARVKKCNTHNCPAYWKGDPYTAVSWTHSLHVGMDCIVTWYSHDTMHLCSNGVVAWDLGLWGLVLTLEVVFVTLLN